MITVYGTPGCPNCDRAKSLLKNKNLDFQYIELDQGQDQVPEKTYISRSYFLELFPEVRYLPYVVENDKKIGGFNELVTYLKGV